MFRGVSFKKSKLIGINWTQASTQAACHYAESLLDYGIFQGINLKGFSFVDCKILEVDFSEAQLSKSSFTGSILRGSNFNKANLSEADFRGASEYLIDVRYSTIKNAKFSLPEALTLLSSLEIIVE